VTKESLNLGIQAEEKAKKFLEKQGYKILCRNYKTKLGEVDIIGQDQDVLCFIEVKCRSSERFGSGLEAVSATKQKQISKAALSYLKEKNLLNKKARFDVVALDTCGAQEKIELIKDAFELNARFTY